MRSSGLIIVAALFLCLSPHHAYSDQQTYVRLEANIWSEPQTVQLLGNGVCMWGDMALGYCRPKIPSDADEPLYELHDPKGRLVEHQRSLSQKMHPSGVVKNSGFWTNAQLPYVVDASLPDGMKAFISQAIATYNALTPISMVARTSESDYIYLTSGSAQLGGSTSSCSSWVGRIGGKQDINLGSGCGVLGTVLHEILHSLGWYHEHTRTDRNTYITVYSNCYQAEAAINFAICTGCTDIGAFDYNSVMMYRQNAFYTAGTGCTGNTYDTIPAKVAEYESTYGAVTLGQRVGFSPLDIASIAVRYDICKTDTSPQSGVGFYWKRSSYKGPCQGVCGASTGRTVKAFCHAKGTGTCVADSNCVLSEKPSLADNCASDLVNLCTFDDGTPCSWDIDQFDVGGDTVWTVARNGTDSTFTGPSFDHTTGAGYFIYTEATSNFNKAAYMASPSIDIPDGSVLSFWFHMYGTDLGTLEVVVSPCSGSANTTVFSANSTLYPSLGDWRSATVALPVASSARIIFKCVTGSGFRSDIALDDVKVSLGNATVAPTPAPTPDPCVALNCSSVGGNCILQSSQAVCSCFLGYSGSRCEVAPGVSIQTSMSGLSLSSGTTTTVNISASGVDSVDIYLMKNSLCPRPTSTPSSTFCLPVSVVASRKTAVGGIVTHQWQVPYPSVATPSSDYYLWVYFSPAANAVTSLFAIVGVCTSDSDCNSGTCQSGECICPAGTGGHNCATTVDLCVNGTCNTNFGSCNSSTGVCTCVNGGQGPTCATSVNCSRCASNAFATAACGCVCNSVQLSPVSEWSGDTCSTCALNCSGRGFPNSLCNGCSCDAGFTQGYSDVECSVQYGEVYIRLQYDYAVVTASSAAITALEQIVRSDVSRALGISTSRVYIASLAAGSVWVQVWLLEPANASQSNVTVLVSDLTAQISNTSSPLYKGAATSTADPAASTSGPTPSNDGDGGSTSIGLIAGVVIAVVVVLVVVSCVATRSKSRKTHPGASY